MILVTGATGNVGREVVDQLLAAGADVRAMTRDPARADLPAAADVVRGDPADDASMVAALTDVDAALLMLPGGAAAAAAALRRVLPRRVVLLSSLTAQTRPGLAHAEAFRVVERTVRGAAPGAAVLRPGQFASNALRWAPMVAAGSVRTAFGDVSLPVIDPADIAAVAVAALTDDAHRGQEYPLSGPERLSARQQVAQLAQVLGRPVELVDQSEAEARAALSMPQDYADYVIEIQARPLPDELEIFSTVADVTGRPARTFADWASRHRSEFEPPGVA